jgi:hypothetical protein
LAVELQWCAPLKQCRLLWGHRPHIVCGAARGIIEIPNRLSAAHTAVVVVHPWCAVHSDVL